MSQIVARIPCINAQKSTRNNMKCLTRIWKYNWVTASSLTTSRMIKEWIRGSLEHEPVRERKTRDRERDVTKLQKTYSKGRGVMVARTTCNPRVVSSSLACVTFVFFFWQERLVHVPTNTTSRGLAWVAYVCFLTAAGLYLR